MSKTYLFMFQGFSQDLMMVIGKSDAMEIPDAQRTEENAAQHDGKNHP